jgi:hypothetical protein
VYSLDDDLGGAKIKHWIGKKNRSKKKEKKNLTEQKNIKI